MMQLIFYFKKELYEGIEGLKRIPEIRETIF